MPTFRRVAALVLALAATACASSSQAPEQHFVAEEWTGDGVVSYRLITKDDFQATSSNSLWGNVAHGAEICTLILPAADHETNGAFGAVMRPDCSFWNKVIGPLGRASRLALLAVGIVTVGGGKQPDWYILQHEQVHFAINEVAARKLSRQLGRIAPERRRDELVQRVYALTLEHASERHQAFDGETSGTYDPHLLEKWVRVLDLEMTSLCGERPECRVRIAD